MTWQQIVLVPILTAVFLYAMVGILDPHTEKLWRISLRQYFGFLSVWFQFHILQMHRNHLSEPRLKRYIERMKYLDGRIPKASWLVAMRLKWERKLLGVIIETAGKYKERATGSRKHKKNYKFVRKGEKRMTTYERGRGDKVTVKTK